MYVWVYVEDVGLSVWGCVSVCVHTCLLACIFKMPGLLLYMDLTDVGKHSVAVQL